MTKDIENENVCNELLKQLGKTKEEVEDQVDYLRKWLLLQPHLPHTADDVILRSFVLGTNWMEQAKQKLDNMYTYRNKYEILQDMDPASFDWNKSLDAGHLPGTTPDGYKILFSRVPDKDRTATFRAAESFKHFSMMIQELMTQNEGVGGHVLIFDMKEFSIELVLKFSLVLFSQMLFVYQSIMPIKAKGFIYFNCPGIVNNFIKTFINPFISEKLKKRIHIYTGGVEELEKHIPLKMLPKEYGGNAPSLKQLCERQKEVLLKKRDWFLTEGSYRSDESKRPPPSTDEFGVQGTFRKLNVD